MGHSDLRTTLRYLDAVDEALVAAVKAHTRSELRQNRDKGKKTGSGKTGK
jgi:hypothetical protein